MTTTTAPNPQAWLAKEATSLGPFVVRVEHDHIAGAVAYGVSVAIMDVAVVLKRVDIAEGGTRL